MESCALLADKLTVMTLGSVDAQPELAAFDVKDRAENAEISVEDKFSHTEKLEQLTEAVDVDVADSSDNRTVPEASLYANNSMSASESAL